MWESAVKKHEEALLEKGATREKQSILIDLMTIKFGELPSTEQAVKRCTNTGKLDLALRKILSAHRREDVLACLSNN